MRKDLFSVKQDMRRLGIVTVFAKYGILRGHKVFLDKICVMYKVVKTQRDPSCNDVNVTCI